MARAKPTTWKNAKRDDTHARRDLILRAATKRLNEHGYARASMTAIAADLGLSTNALYYYFESKVEILSGCFERALGLIEGCADFAEHKPDCTGNERIQAFVEHFRQLIEAEPLPGSWLLVHLPRERLTTIAQRDGAFRVRLYEIVRAGIADGSIRDCDVASTIGILLSGMYTLPYSSLREQLGERTFHDQLQRFTRRALAP